jgi:hypothetical protein
MGEPPEPHTGVDSNVTPFVLHPTITATAAPVSSRMAGGVRLCTNNVSLNVSPKVGVGQRVVLLLNEFNPPSTRRARSYRFDVEVIAAHPADKSVNPLTTQVKDVAVGKYLVRIQVDGAESPLDLETDPNNPRFATPRVNIT